MAFLMVAEKSTRVVPSPPKPPPSCLGGMFFETCFGRCWDLISKEQAPTWARILLEAKKNRGKLRRNYCDEPGSFEHVAEGL